MANSTSSNKDFVQLCRSDDTLCNSLAIEITLVGLNLLSVVINSLHLFILSKIRSLQGTPYLCLLQFIASIDVADGVVCALRASCFPRKVLQSSRPLSAVVTVFASLLTVKYYMALSIAIERFIALVFPLKYERNLFIRKISLWLCLQIGAVMLEGVWHNLFQYESICINTHYGPNDISTNWTSKIIMAMRILPSLAIVILMTMVFLELGNMKKKALSSQEKELVNATKSVMIICCMMVSCLIPPFLSLFLIWNTSITHITTGTVSLVAIVLYSIMNSIIYGWRTDKYRQVVAGFFRSHGHFQSSSFSPREQPKVSRISRRSS